MMDEHQWSSDEFQALTWLGLAITPHSDPANGWGYTWQGRDWTGPFPRLMLLSLQHLQKRCRRYSSETSTHG
jgi:hypothetical protein